ncbi:MAG: CoA transferase [Pseudomonadales bacterium]|jgi:CoA:oxalate CoA-transferase|nr:CoA transferase [Pseudomonadales bacterium]
MSGPLAGIKVIDVGLLVQGPQAAATLADMGAEVIKIELPGLGDHSRFVFIAEDDFRSAYFTACNRGKRGLTLDLRIPAGADIFRRLAKEADIIISNFKPGTMDEWGLGYEQLKVLNPGLIWAAGSAFGPIGPDADREGADLAGQAAGGLISTIGADGQVPSPVGVTIADHIASQNLTAGVLAALVHRGTTNMGQKVEVSLLGGQIWAQAAEYSHFLISGEMPSRANYGHPLINGIYRILQTADGWIGIIGVPPAAKDGFFISLGKPELSVDPRFEGPILSSQALAFLWSEIEPIVREHPTAHWEQAFREAGVRYAPVRNYRQVTQDPGAWENGYFQEVTNQQGESVQIVGNPIAMSATPLNPAGWAPELGEHTDEILKEIGITEAELKDLKDQQAI